VTALDEEIQDLRDYIAGMPENIVNTLYIDVYRERLKRLEAERESAK
jgi:hypothetical protein